MYDIVRGTAIDDVSGLGNMVVVKHELVIHFTAIAKPSAVVDVTGLHSTVAPRPEVSAPVWVGMKDWTGCKQKQPTFANQAASRSCVLKALQKAYCTVIASLDVTGSLDVEDFERLGMSKLFTTQVASWFLVLSKEELRVPCARTLPDRSATRVTQASSRSSCARRLRELSKHTTKSEETAFSTNRVASGHHRIPRNGDA